MKFIINYTDRLKIGQDKIIKSSLTFSIISLYGKCFTDATQSKAPKLEAKEIFKNKEEMRETHEYLMELRHHFISHRGESDGEVEAAYILVPKSEGDPQIRFHRLKQISFNNEQLESIELLIKFIMSELKTKMDKSGLKAYRDYFKLFTPEQMSFMTINNMKEIE